MTNAVPDTVATDTIWLGGHPHPALLLRPANPALPPPQLRTLLDEHPHALSLAPHPAATAPWGYWRFTNGCRLRFPPGRPRTPTHDGLRPISEADAEQVLALLTRRARQLAGPGARLEGLWARMQADPDSHWLVFAQDDVITGVMGLTAKGASEPAHVNVKVFALLDETPQAFGGMMDHLGTLLDRGLAVDVESLPADRPSVAVGSVVSKQRADLDRTMAVRPGQPEAWLRALRYQPGDGDLRLAVHDPLGLWPGTLQFRWTGGSLADWGPTRAPADVTIAVQGLPALTSGQMSVEQLTFAGWLDGPSDRCRQMGRIWQTQPLHRFDWEKV